MSTLLIILLVLAGLIVIVLIMAAFVATEYVIVREITISQSVQKAFDYLKHLKNQDYWSKWVMMDPNARKTYTGTDGTIGFIAAWDSDNKNVGKGEQEIKSMKEGERLDVEVRFEKPFKGTSFAYYMTQPDVAGQTRVSWSLRGTRNYPMKIFYFLFNLKKVLGNDMALSLSNLKKTLEK